MIDRNGFRLNVGIILANQEGRLFWAKRVGKRDAWQFPQGGIHDMESLEEAMFRELEEEVGLTPRDVDVVAVTKRWLYYHLPKHLRRYHSKPLCVGQRQRWFLLRFTGGDEKICFDQTEAPEFDQWRWVDYWHPLENVIAFKRSVYRKALREFAPYIDTNL